MMEAHEVAPERPSSRSAAVREAKRAIPSRRVGGRNLLHAAGMFIVYNGEEYAATLPLNPSAFRTSILGSTGLLPAGRRTACNRYPSSRRHLMLAVIGSSFMTERVKGVYENTFDAPPMAVSSTLKKIDYATQTASEYCRFMHTRRGMSFPSAASCPASGRRRTRGGRISSQVGSAVSLSSSTDQSGYGWVIRKSSKSVYGNEDEWVCAWADTCRTRLRDSGIAASRGSRRLAHLALRATRPSAASCRSS